MFHGFDVMPHALVLVKLSVPNSGAAVDKVQVKDEAKLAPKDGEKVKVGDAEYRFRTFGCMTMEPLPEAETMEWRNRPDPPRCTTRSWA